MSSIAVILADGNFPVHEIPLGYLNSSEHIICCDGSAENLVKAGLEPEAIVGDLDSLKSDLKQFFSDRLFQDSDQDTNDLTKAVKWCIGKGYEEIIILGATGKRDDHTIGNISLLAEYSKEISVIMVTDTGTIAPFPESAVIKSFTGQKVSIFSINPGSEITSAGLKYELSNLKLNNWWRGTLNESLGESFTLTFTGGTVLVYQKFGDE